MPDTQHPAAILAALLDAHPALRAYVGVPEASEAPHPDAYPERTDQLQATVIWQHGEPLLPGRRYQLRIGGETAMATVAPLRYRVNLASGERMAATMLERDEVGVCDLELDEMVAVAPYDRDPSRGTLQRDPKGLYAKARRGELRNFTGIDSPYEPPEAPELRIATTEMSADSAAAGVLELLEERGLLPRR